MGSTISNIKRDRVRYWRHRNGESYRAISISENASSEYHIEAKKAIKSKREYSESERDKAYRHLSYVATDAESIRKSIKQYEKRLKQARPET